MYHNANIQIMPYNVEIHNIYLRIYVHEFRLQKAVVSYFDSLVILKFWKKISEVYSRYINFSFAIFLW